MGKQSKSVWPQIYFITCIVLVVQVKCNLQWLSLQTPAGANTLNFLLLVMGSIKWQLEQCYCVNYWIIWIKNLKNLI